jgi:DNA-directed RNA polymerase subunit beta
MPAIRTVRNNELEVADEKDADYALDDTSGFFSTNANLVPLASAVQGPRVFYGARFFEQALPLRDREAPLVRNLEASSGRSWDYVMGEHAGAVRSKGDGLVTKVTPDEIHLKHPDGSSSIRELYNRFPNNRKTLTHNEATVKEGDQVKPGDLLASSNFTDGEGRLALGTNARIGLGAYKGHSMDDAVVIRAGYASRLTSDHAETLEQVKDVNLKAGKAHYISLFHKKFNLEQLDKLDDDGMVVPGTILQPGDPLMLFTKPRAFNSQNENIGKLSRGAKFVRKDAAKVWEGDDPAEVLDVARTRDGGVKVFLRYQSPARPGDKLVLRQGAKGTISMIIPDDKMPRTEDGQPLDLLLNQLSLPSRVNAATFHELILGKIATKTGKAYTLPAFTKPGEDWMQFVGGEMEKNGVTAEERVFDPEEDAYLDNPLTVGVGHVLKLHHLAAGKMSARGSSSYSADRQPMKGGGGGGGAQRLSGLEMNVLHSSGARGVQKEAILLRGELRDDYWKAVRNNRTAPKLGRPFVWDKFQALLNGSGVNAKDLGKGRQRLTPLTDKELKARNSMEVLNDGIVDLGNFEPKPGGLFDPRMVREQRWGHISLPFPVINPAYEDTVKALLGLSQKEYQALLDQPPDARVL